MADAVAIARDILWVPVTRADELAILHGIACALLSRAVWPAERECLASDALHDPLPDVFAGVQAKRTHFGVSQRHAARATNEVV
jgi:hypothetical protein